MSLRMRLKRWSHSDRSADGHRESSRCDGIGVSRPAHQRCSASCLRCSLFRRSEFETAQKSSHRFRPVVKQLVHYAYAASKVPRTKAAVSQSDSQKASQILSAQRLVPRSTATIDQLSRQARYHCPIWRRPCFDCLFCHSFSWLFRLLPWDKQTLRIHKLCKLY